MKEKVLYAYALGYYYGRAEGHDPDPYAAYEDICKLLYKQGYEAGVADHCYEIEGEVR
jgi:hypothetical protein